jgi:carbon monoxide dehydrogenase subunit G
MTYTYAVLDVPRAVYAAVRALLDAADYGHAFHVEKDGEVIDMHGIALRVPVPDGSVVDLVAHAAVSPGAEEETLLDWDGEAAMRGPVAAVGGRVLDRQAQRLIEQTFGNVRKTLQGG